jgi:hypothetical protein
MRAGSIGMQQNCWTAADEVFCFDVTPSTSGLTTAAANVLPFVETKPKEIGGGCDQGSAEIR